MHVAGLCINQWIYYVLTENYFGILCLPCTTPPIMINTNNKVIKTPEGNRNNSLLIKNLKQ